MAIANQKYGYGDSIFPWRSHLRSNHKGGNLTDQQRKEDWGMKKVRISVEWNYGETSQLFPFVDYNKNIKIQKMAYAKIYFCAAFLRNCHNFLYPNITSQYFDMLPPTLDDCCLQIPLNA